MSSMFVTGKVAITATGVSDEKDLSDQTDVIFIRPKMDYGTRQRVIGSAAKMVEQQTSAPRRARRASAAKAQAAKFDFDVGQYQIALLVHNVIGWAGPSFAGYACTPANVEKLDSDKPLVQMAIKEIAERNAPADADADAADDEQLALDDPNVIEMAATS
jgi:hypothetical protein